MIVASLFVGSIARSFAIPGIYCKNFGPMRTLCFGKSCLRPK